MDAMHTFFSQILWMIFCIPGIVIIGNFSTQLIGFLIPLASSSPPQENLSSFSSGPLLLAPRSFRLVSISSNIMMMEITIP